MYSTYHFKSAADINMEVLDDIKAAYKDKPVVLTIWEDDNSEFELPDAERQFVLNSIKEYSEKPELLVSEKDAWKMIG